MARRGPPGDGALSTREREVVVRAQRLRRTAREIRWLRRFARRSGRSSVDGSERPPPRRRAGRSRGAGSISPAGVPNRAGWRSGRPPVIVRFRDRPRLTLSARALPVLGGYDVVVVGGGTSGAPAAMAAARNGAKTLVIEYLDELGGVGTAGLIGVYWYGYRSGEGRETEARIREPDGDSVRRGAPRPAQRLCEGGRRRSGRLWVVEAKAEWLRREILTAGGEIWFNCFGCGALVDDGKAAGVVVAGPLRARRRSGQDGYRQHRQRGHRGRGRRPDRLQHIDPRRPLRAGGRVSASRPRRAASTPPTPWWTTRTCSTAGISCCAGRSQRRISTTTAQLIDSRERRRVVGEYVLRTTDILNGAHLSGHDLSLPEQFRRRRISHRRPVPGQGHEGPGLCR